MSKQPKPDAKLNLIGALYKFGDPNLHEEWMHLRTRLSNLGGSRSRTLSWVAGGEVVTDQTANRRYHLEGEIRKAFLRFSQSMWRRIIDEELVAFGRKDRPDAEPDRIKAAFQYFRPEYDFNKIVGSGDATYYDISICHRDELSTNPSGAGRASDGALIRFLVQKDRDWQPESMPRPTKKALMQEALQAFPGLSATHFKAVWKTAAPARLRQAGAPKKKP